MEKENIRPNPPSPCVDGFDPIHICPSMYAAHDGSVLEKGFYFCEDDITDKLKNVTDIQKKFIQSFCSVPTKKLVEVLTYVIKLTMRPTNNSTVIVTNYHIEGIDENNSRMMVFVNNKLDILDYMPNDIIITYLCNCIKRFQEFEAPQEIEGCLE